MTDIDALESQINALLSEDAPTLPDLRRGPVE